MLDPTKYIGGGGRNIPKEELLADSKYNTDYRTFGLSFGDYDALLHKGPPYGSP